MIVLKFGGSSVANATRISAVMDIVESALALDRVVLVSSAISGCTDALLQVASKRKSLTSSQKEIAALRCATFAMTEAVAESSLQGEDCHTSLRCVRNDEQNGPSAQSAQLSVSSLRGAEGDAAISYDEDLCKLQQRHQAIISRLFTGVEREKVLADNAAIFSQISQYQGDSIEAFGEILLTRILAAKFQSSGIATTWLDSRQLITKRASEVDIALSYSQIAQAIESHPESRLFVAPGFIASDENGNMTTLGRGGSDYSAALYAAALKADTLQIWTDVPGIMTANPKDVPSASTIATISYEAAQTLAENGAKVLYAPTVQPAMQALIDINIRNTFDPSNPGTIICSKPEAVTTQYIGVTSQNLTDCSRICLVTEGIQNRDAIATRIVRALHNQGLCALAEVYAEGAVYYLDVSQNIARQVVAILHKEFFEQRNIFVTDIFIAGYGAVAKALLRLIEQSSVRIAQKLSKSIRVVGVSNSSRFIIDPKGLDSQRIATALAGAAQGGDYIAAVAQCASRNAVFVDCTDSSSLYKQYCTLFEKGVNVVTSNRRSLAVPYAEYTALKRVASENGCFFRYDTTVGASLPILESIASSENCSDEIESIEAVVSCTVNKLLSSYVGSEGESLANLLREAQASGLTESDPRIDLSGSEVLRKLLIIAREAGVKLEESDVKVKPVLSEEYFSCSLSEFYDLLESNERLFAEDFACKKKAKAHDVFVAALYRDAASPLGYRASISMRTEDSDSPFNSVTGTENIIQIRSRHCAPLVIKGAGEGAKQAAIGIIKDILQ